MKNRNTLSVPDGRQWRYINRQELVDKSTLNVAGISHAVQTVDAVAAAAADARCRLPQPHKYLVNRDKY